MSDSTALVPYASLSDILKGGELVNRMDDLSNRVRAFFITVEKQLQKGDESVWRRPEKSVAVTEEKKDTKTPYEKLESDLTRLNKVVFKPVEKSASYFLGALGGMEKDARTAQSLEIDEERFQALKYAAQQSGGDQSALEKSIKKVYAFWKNDSQGETLLNHMGIDTRDEKGEQRDNSDVFLQLTVVLESMDRQGARQQAAELFGIDEDTLNAMQRGLAQYTEEYQHLAAMTGSDAQRSAEQASRFMGSWREMTSVIDLFGHKSSGALAEGLDGPLNMLTEKLLSKAPQIENVLGKISASIVRLGSIFADALSGLIDLVTDVVSWWDTLDSGSQPLIATLAMLTSAWLALNSAFLASPIGIVLALVGAIGLLYSDFMKWKSGGESLIDWDKWAPALALAADVIGSLITTIKGLAKAFLSLLGIDFSSWSISSIFKGLLAGFNQLGETLEKVGRLIQAIKEADWGKVVDIGKELIDSGLKNSAPAKLLMLGASYVEEKASKASSAIGEFFMGGDNKPADAVAAPRLSPDAMDNLAQPNAPSLLMGASFGVANQRYASNSEISQTTSHSVSSPTFNNKTDIVINGAGDPVAVANEVESRQLSAHSRFTQMNTVGLS